MREKMNMRLLQLYLETGEESRLERFLEYGNVWILSFVRSLLFGTEKEKYDPEDIAQKAIMKVWKVLTSRRLYFLNEVENKEDFILTIIKNVALREIKVTNRRNKNFILSDVKDPAGICHFKEDKRCIAPLVTMEDEEKYSRIWRELLDCSEKKPVLREVILMRFGEERVLVREIAKKLKLKEKTIEVSLVRMRREIFLRLHKEGGFNFKKEVREKFKSRLKSHLK